jgi:hypothetical protein
MHGLAFAALLGGLDLSRGSLLTELVGFNLGIELTQLIVVALVMPSLMVLSRTSLYPAIRVTLASSGILLAAGWLAERTRVITSNPLDGISTALVTHPFVVAATLACLATAAWVVPSLRNAPYTRNRRQHLGCQHPRATADVKTEGDSLPSSAASAQP